MVGGRGSQILSMYQAALVEMLGAFFVLWNGAPNRPNAPDPQRDTPDIGGDTVGSALATLYAKQIVIESLNLDTIPVIEISPESCIGVGYLA